MVFARQPCGVGELRDRRLVLLAHQLAVAQVRRGRRHGRGAVADLVAQRFVGEERRWEVFAVLAAERRSVSQARGGACRRSANGRIPMRMRGAFERGNRAWIAQATERFRRSPRDASIEKIVEQRNQRIDRGGVTDEAQRARRTEPDFRFGARKQRDDRGAGIARGGPHFGEVAQLEDVGRLLAESFREDRARAARVHRDEDVVDLRGQGRTPRAQRDERRFGACGVGSKPAQHQQRARDLRIGGCRILRDRKQAGRRCGALGPHVGKHRSQAEDLVPAAAAIASGGFDKERDDARAGPRDGERFLVVGRVLRHQETRDAVARLFIAHGDARDIGFATLLALVVGERDSDDSGAYKRNAQRQQEFHSMTHGIPEAVARPAASKHTVPNRYERPRVRRGESRPCLLRHKNRCITQTSTSPSRSCLNACGMRPTIENPSF